MVAKLTAQEFFGQKVQIPTDLLTKQMSLLELGLRERAFWSAGVEDARLLADLQRAVDGAVQGGAHASGRAAITAALDKWGYKPAMGTEGTIKDLRSRQRMDVILQVNEQMAQGYTQLQRAQDALENYPCWEFVRVEARDRPRLDWEDRWKRAGGHFFAGGRMIALINDPVWQRLSVFRTPYPPFDYNSGMGVEPVDRDEAVRLSVIAPKEILERAPEQSFNQNLETHLDASEAVWQGVLDHFQGTAERVGDKLIFTDANGTKPYDAQKIVDVISAPLPNIYGKGVNPNFQMEGIIQWADDSSGFKAHPGRDMPQHMRRLADRIIPQTFDVLYRGMEFDNWEAREKFLMDMSEASGHRVKDFYESFSKNLKTGLFFAGATKPKVEFGVVIKLLNSKSGHDISHAVAKYAPRLAHEEEVVFSRGSHFKEKSRRTIVQNGKKLLEITVEEKK